jgi:hypothetical protein
MKTTVHLTSHESVTVESIGPGVVLELVAFGVPLARKSLTRAQARELGDALGFASNDVPAPARPCKNDSHQGRPCDCWGKA